MPVSPKLCLQFDQSGFFVAHSPIFKGSAVCMYSMADIRRAFLGPFAHKEGPAFQWVNYQGKVPYPRPGTCPSSRFGGFHSTKDYPDTTLSFVRSHPIMAQSVHPMGGRPRSSYSELPTSLAWLWIESRQGMAIMTSCSWAQVRVIWNAEAERCTIIIVKTNFGGAL
uniref:Sema domain-containing protein n=1 Tax=Eptatretus burgeri TaxID=7764 RepID=A0A8C4QY63_EPTBU